MEWYISVFFLIVSFSLIQSTCVQPNKFYVDCGQTRTISLATAFCQSHQMTLLNLTNGTASLSSDIAILNTTFHSKNCNGNFWFSSGSRTGLVADTNELGDLLGGLLGGVLNLLCIIPFICPAATTAAPILNAFTVCTRPTQQRIIQKCLTQNLRLDMPQFRFNEQSLQAGILDTFSSRSLMACSGICSANDDCIAMSYKSGTCTLYM